MSCRLQKTSAETCPQIIPLDCKINPKSSILQVFIYNTQMRLIVFAIITQLN